MGNTLPGKWWLTKAEFCVGRPARLCWGRGGLYKQNWDLNASKSCFYFFLDFYLFLLTIFHIILPLKCFACSSLHGVFILYPLQMFENTCYSLLMCLLISSCTILPLQIPLLMKGYVAVLFEKSAVVLLESYYTCKINAMHKWSQNFWLVSLNIILQCRLDYGNIQISVLHFFSCYSYTLDFSFPIFRDVYRSPLGLILQMLMHV